MPLLYQTHRPPQLDQEIRALWRIVDRLQTNAIAAGGTGLQGPPGDPGETETLRGTVHSWIQLIEVGPASHTSSPINVEFAPDLPVPITGGYTHLDAYMGISQQSSSSVASVSIRGNTNFFKFVPEGDPLDHDIIGSPAVFYESVLFSGGLGPGHYLLGPTVYGGDTPVFNPRIGLSYFPIKTTNGRDSLRVEFRLTWPSQQGCFKGFLHGRYVLHESLLFAKESCPSL